MLPILFALMLGCAENARSEPASPAVSASTSPAQRGETAAWTVEGTVVHVNNHLCAVSHSPLDPQKLDAFASTVAYSGPDPRFAGKTLVFNQCCEMCIERFPAMWMKDPDAILRFHGLI